MENTVSSIPFFFFFLPSFNLCCQTVGFLHLTIILPNLKREKEGEEGMVLQKVRNTKIYHCQTMGVTSIVPQLGKKMYNVFRDYIIGTKEKLGLGVKNLESVSEVGFTSYPLSLN
ncbi:hypothetical protein ACB092_04G162700 [Castanea dentata]